MNAPLGVIRPATVDDAARVASLHAGAIPDGFLSTLGPRFLRRLYARAARSPHSFVLVADSGSGVEGFVAAVERTSAFYRDFVVRDGLVAGLAAVPHLVRAPRRVWETLRYGTGRQDGLPAAEILSVAVAPGARGRGLGRALVDAAIAELTRRGVPGARVVTAVGNTAAMRAYVGAGFRPHGRLEVHAGTPQELLVWP
jgi:ribosomal protein S18 acetylase RimI-like enzyme